MTKQQYVDELKRLLEWVRTQDGDKAPLGLPLLGQSNGFSVEDLKRLDHEYTIQDALLATNGLCPTNNFEEILSEIRKKVGFS